MLIIVVVAVLLVLSVWLGITSYRRTLARGSYTGSLKGAFQVASVLGACLGTSVALVTLLIVLAVRQAR